MRRAVLFAFLALAAPAAAAPSLTVAGYDGGTTVQRIDARTLETRPGTQTLAGTVQSVENSPDGAQVMALGEDSPTTGVLTFLDRATLAPSGPALPTAGYPLGALWLAPDRALVVTDQPARVDVVDLATRAIVAFTDLGGFPADAVKVGAALAVVVAHESGPVGVRLFDATGPLRTVVLGPTAGEVHLAALDGTLFAVSSGDRRITTIDAATGAATATALDLPSNAGSLQVLGATARRLIIGDGTAVYGVRRSSGAVRREALTSRATGYGSGWAGYGRGVTGHRADGDTAWRALKHQRVTAVYHQGPLLYATAGRRSYAIDTRTGEVVGAGRAQPRRPLAGPPVLPASDGAYAHDYYPTLET